VDQFYREGYTGKPAEPPSIAGEDSSQNAEKESKVQTLRPGNTEFEKHAIRPGFALSKVK